MRYTSDNDMIEKILAAQPKEKQASATFLSKQREKAQGRKASSTISPLSETQAERDRKPLSAEEILAMFTGAPYFNVEDRRPQVIFRGGDAVRAARYSTDYEKLDVSSFGACTLGQHRTRQLEGKPSPCCHETQPAKEESTFMLLEVPSQLAATGREPGAIGFENYVQLPVADSLVVAEKVPSMAKRKLLRTDPEQLGLRKVDMEDLIKRLNELTDLYATKHDEIEASQYWDENKVEELGDDLFNNILSDELSVKGDSSLKTQISALQKVLDAPNVWHDFSIVEWRIRVGQLLWASDDTEKPSERNVLLLQITLAAELLARLVALESMPTAFSSTQPLLTAEDADILEKERSTKIKWDLLLAERFLEKVSIAKKPSEEDSRKQNRSSLWSAITFLTAKETVDDDFVEPIVSPKDDLRQIDGLVNFAEAIYWPHAKEIRQDLEAKLSAGIQTPGRSGPRPLSTNGSAYATPLTSPLFPGTPGTSSSFFGFVEQKTRPGFARTTTAQSVRLLPSRSTAGSTGLDTGEAFEVGGWLSRSWLSGLVLPGEPASHFLISTLLENSPQAITALGAEANLYGGFVYEGRSFWSKGCVVGRVLGAAEGSAECMGWVSVPGAGVEELEDGWLAVNVKDRPPQSSGKKERIMDSDAVARASDPLHGEPETNIQAGDFVTPADSNLVLGNEVKLHGLLFSSGSTLGKPSKESSLPMAGISDPEPLDASLVFSSSANSKLSKVSVPLTYDVQFVSSYPCHPPRLKSRPINKPFAQDAKLSVEEEKENDPKPAEETRQSKKESKAKLRASIQKELPPPPAHPLHIDFSFSTVPVATLLSQLTENRPRALSSPGERQAADHSDRDSEEVVVLDCRGTEDLELLARAWCSKTGNDALIGKSGRTCLACCIREARALDIAVVIRT